jgi:hypothetical protein
MSDFKEILIFSTEFSKYGNVSIHEIPSSGSQIVACGRTDMTKTDSPFPQFCERA